MPPGAYDHIDLREVLFEIYRIGNSVKVSALDPQTNTEVAIVGSPHMSPYSLKTNAIRKLRYVIAKNQAERAIKG
jgi:hypothetical protein